MLASRYLAALFALILTPSVALALPPTVAFTSPTTIDEGTDVTVMVSVTDPDGDPVTWSWDTDYDMVFGELPGGTSHTVPASDTDGTVTIYIGVRATDGTETRTIYRNITVRNVEPEITTHPLTEAALGREYRYEIGVTDPGGANDPIEHILGSSPTGMELTGNVITWTPTPDQRGRSFDVTLRVQDGDGGEDSQAWSIAVARNTAPSAPTPVTPVLGEAVSEGEPVTLVAENGADPDGDPLTYYFRLSRSTSFDGADVRGSGEIAEGADGRTSWTTDSPLPPGLWYWQVWVSDGIVETLPRHGHAVVGSNTVPEGGVPDAGVGGRDGSVILMPRDRGGDGGGCSVAGGTRGPGGCALAFWLALALLGVRMRKHRRSSRGAAMFLAAAVAAVVAIGCGDDDGNTTPAPDASVADVFDTDGDGISDTHESARDQLDTDDDGIPDYQDPDSDGDGIPDYVEAGDMAVESAPRDSDMDGTPDFQDTDSDNNGIPDGIDGTGDADLDGLPDYADLDDDNDLVRDAMELADIIHPPADTDGDGVPNYQDPDSDDDGILDGDESGVDTDGDGLRDFEDADSDNDGIPDSDEAGDDDLYSAPIDTDSDGTPDFRDTDSDNDGLSDRSEREGGTDPRNEDSDGDGVTDLIEYGAGTDPLDGTVSPLTRGDFVFVVPYEEEPTPTRDTLNFRTSLQLVDLYFLFDISGSMSTEIGSLRTAVTTIIGDLTCTDFGTACVADGDCAAGEVCSIGGSCIEDPTASGCVSNPWTGGGIYEAELENLLSLQNDPARTSTALGVSTFGGIENLYRAVWNVADPAGAPGSPSACTAAMPGFVGCPAFREDAVKILVAFTDEDSDGSETVAQAAGALRDQDITFIGVWSGTSGAAARSALVDLANASGSLSGAGTPLVFDGMDSGVVPAVTAAINEVVQGVPLRVTIAAADEPDDAGDALQFIDYLEINTTSPECTAVGLTEDTDADGHDDAFPSLLPGTPVCWDVVPLRNDTVEPTTDPLVFRARLTVSGDGSPLDSRTIYFLVPPFIPPPDLPI